ncbi:F0F1 ATP synthase subunit A [Clostridium botulinum]|uniref:F0F1 ATP synthase subunit A n=1 Tax=Clostridium botulinum TaxID=1491 RepID=UPI0017497C9E|nr:F0F1 ATP synthase subunit A [Clostridium botulinum]MBD5637303.1 F0F1 ATP synthase subunit A [Clostridium botulinum]
MEKILPLFYINLFGYKFGITSTLITQWVIIVIISLMSIILTRNLKKVPDKKQTIMEIMLNSVRGLVNENMGPEFKKFVPYVGTLMIYLLLMNLMGLLGFKPPTLDLSLVAGIAVISFIVIQGYAIKKSGTIHYLTGYGKPYLFLLPLNILERIMLPVSLSLRLFGNMTAAVLIMDLVYSALSRVSSFAQLVIPIPFHIYFDLFDGTIQMFIFVMLTMINIKVISEH